MGWSSLRSLIRWKLAYEIGSSAPEDTPYARSSWQSVKNLLLTVLVRLLKHDILISADLIPTSLLESLDNNLQETIVGDQVKFALNWQEFTLAEIQGFSQRARRHFRAAETALKYPWKWNTAESEGGWLQVLIFGIWIIRIKMWASRIFFTQEMSLCHSKCGFLAYDSFEWRCAVLGPFLHKKWAHATSSADFWHMTHSNGDVGL